MENNNIEELLKFVSLNNSNNEIKTNKKKKIKLFFINILTITLLVTSGIGIKTYFDQKKDAEEVLRLKEELKKEVIFEEEIIENTIHNEEIKEEFIEEFIEEVIKKPDYSLLVKENNDMVGWLTVLGTDIDMPIVQTNNNDFYMNHDFNKKWNSMGWAFADYRNSFPNLSRNTILYGHTYKDTIIFSNLKNVLKNNWLNDKEKQYITFNIS